MMFASCSFLFAYTRNYMANSNYNTSPLCSLHNTVYGKSYLCTYLSFLKRILTSKPSNSFRRPQVTTHEGKAWLTSGLLCEMLGSSTCRNFLSRTVYEILIYRHYSTCHSPFYPTPELQRKQHTLLANKALLNHDTCYNLIPWKQ